MAQDSKRKRQLRRVKRERSQLRQAIGVQQNQLQTLVKLTIQAQREAKELKVATTQTRPSLRVTMLADEVEPDTAAEVADVNGLHDATAETIGYYGIDDSPFIDPDYSEPVEEIR